LPTSRPISLHQKPKLLRLHTKSTISRERFNSHMQ
jgi:hypothetical protein